MEKVLNLNKSINLKNVLGVGKYTFRTLRIIYIIEAVILVLSLSSNTFISRYTFGADLIPAISIILTMNFISHFILFSNQLSKDYGKLLFLTPTKGIEFIIGNFLELLIVDLIPVILVSLSALANSNGLTLASSSITSVSLSIFVGTVEGYLVITGLIAIMATYIKSTGLCVLAVIMGSIFGNMIYSFVSEIILHFLPYFYVTIGKHNAIEIDIFSAILGIIALVILQLVAANRIDKKLDII